MKNQKTQMVILCCLIALVLGLGVFKVMGGNKPNAGPQKQQAAVVEQSTQAEPDKPSDVEEDADSSVAAEVSVVPESKPRDPFIPQVVVQQNRSRNTVGSKPAPLVSRMPQLPLPLITPLSPQPIDFQPSAQASSDPDDPAGVLRLTGVIEGSCSVAIIRGESGARYIVREGQSVDGKYIVKSISRTGVRLKYGSKTYILSLGTAPARKPS